MKRGCLLGPTAESSQYWPASFSIIISSTATGTAASGTTQAEVTEVAAASAAVAASAVAASAAFVVAMAEGLG